MSQILPERYRDRMVGVLSCYDRIVITGTLPGACYAGGMTSLLTSTSESRNPLMLCTPAFAWAPTMPANDESFFKALGARIAELRKEQGLSQQGLADQLGIARQTLAHYEGARLRVPASMLPALANILLVSVEELIGQPAKAARGKRGPTPKLAQHMGRISQLPKPKQRFVMEMFDTVLAQASR